MIEDDYRTFINQKPTPKIIIEGIFFAEQIQGNGVARKEIISAVATVRKIKINSAKLRVTRAISAARRKGHPFNGKQIKEDNKMDVAEQDKNVIVESAVEVLDKEEENQMPVNDDEENEAKLVELAEEIRNYAKQIRNNIISIGNCLIQAKAQVKHGGWNDWVEQNTTFTRYTAYRFMQCAKRFEKVAPAKHLNSTQMIELLALPKKQTDEFFKAKEEEGKQVKDMTKKELRSEIKDWKKTHSASTKNKVSDSNINEQDIQGKTGSVGEQQEFRTIELRVRIGEEKDLAKILEGAIEVADCISDENKIALQRVIETLSTASADENKKDATS